ncbi:MAG: hypothetical protein MMC33_001446 [Icmadophila ericetorum]|nr:hypothetical protein [Icmadophila ericetorum]
MDAYQPSSGENSFDIPPLMNQPPQFFGANAPGSPGLGTGFSASFFPDDVNGGSVEENNEAKRRRIARACDMCRKKKIKCDGKMPSCSHCLNYKTECIFTQVEKKRNPPKGAKYIEGLENRLGRMESLLKLSGLLNEEDGDRTDLGTLEKRLADKTQSLSNGNTPANSAKSPGRSESIASLPNGSQYNTPQPERRPSSHSPITSPGTEKEGEEEVEALSDMMCSLVTNNCGETRYIGSSSGFSIFSPKGIQWVNEKTGDASFQDMISSAAIDENKWMYWKPEIFSDIFDRRVFTPLPPQHEALSLLKDFFENFNCMFPLFHEPTFMHLVNRHYGRDPYDGSGWWASLNVALAIAHRLRVMSNLVSKDEDHKAWGFLKNAMGVLTELTMRNTDLLSVQALLGMALFLQGTPNPQPSFFLVAAALRLAHSIGLHKRGSGFNLNPVEVEQRKRVFWIAYMLDKECVELFSRRFAVTDSNSICLRSGRPPAQDDDDMNVELPSADPPDNVGNIPLADGKGKTNLFRLMCTFATIESKVYKQLYSTKAAKQSDGALLNTIGELDHELEEWKDNIPIDFRPEHEIKASHTPLILHVVVLHFAYYNCLTTIHRMSVHHGYWTSRLSNYAIQGLNARPLNPRVFSSAALCVQAARASIHLIRYIPQGDYACVWMILYYPVSSLVTLFANILQNPQDARARSDIRLMNQVVQFLELLAVDEETGGVKRMLNVCSEFERIAKVVLDKADKESHSRRKRKNNKEDPEADKSILPEKRPLPRTPESVASTLPKTPNFLSADFNGGEIGASFNPSVHTFSSPASSKGELPLPEYTGMPAPADFPSILNGGAFTDFGDMQGFPNIGPPLNNMGSFQQPFVPQDLWQMPMTLEWDWADMNGNGQFAGFDTSGGTDAAGLMNGAQQTNGQAGYNLQ